LPGDQLLYQAFIQAPPVTVIDVFDASGLFQAGFSEPIEQLPVGAFRGRAIDQQAEPFFEAQAIDVVHAELTSGS
jgi:hypothetical protein